LRQNNRSFERDARNDPLLLHGQCTTTDKIPETPANIIKAVAYLLEEVTVAEDADETITQLTKFTVTANSYSQPTAPQLTSSRP